MAVLFWTLALFLIASLLHVLIWRTHKPASSLKALLIVYLAVGVSGLAFLALAQGDLRTVGLPSLLGVAAYLRVLAAFVAMTFTYTICYTLIEWDSPTLTLVNLIVSAGRHGLDESRIADLADQQPFIQSRVQSLIDGGLLVEKNGRYLIAPGKHVFYRSILFYHRLLKTQTTG